MVSYNLIDKKLIVSPTAKQIYQLSVGFGVVFFLGKVW